MVSDRRKKREPRHACPVCASRYFTYLGALECCQGRSEPLVVGEPVPQRGSIVMEPGFLGNVPGPELFFKDSPLVDEVVYDCRKTTPCPKCGLLLEPLAEGGNVCLCWKVKKINTQPYKPDIVLAMEFLEAIEELWLGQSQ